MIGAMHVLAGGQTYTILVNGRRERFEDHPQVGPVPVTAEGEVRALGPKHKFWMAVTQWQAAGKKVDSRGLCHWVPPPLKKVEAEP